MPLNIFNLFGRSNFKGRMRKTVDSDCALLSTYRHPNTAFRVLLYEIASENVTEKKKTGSLRATSSATTFSQTTNFKLFQTERLCRRLFQI